MKKKCIMGFCAFLVVIFMVPVPMRLKDGGTVVYKSLLYRIEDVHKLNPDSASEKEFLDGITIRFFGVEIFNNVK